MSRRLANRVQLYSLRHSVGMPVRLYSGVRREAADSISGPNSTKGPKNELAPGPPLVPGRRPLAPP